MFRKRFAITLITILFMLLFCACQAPSLEESSYPASLQSSEAVSMHTEEEVYTLSSNDLDIQFVMKNKSDETVAGGYDFQLEKQIGDTWYVIPVEGYIVDLGMGLKPGAKATGLKATIKGSQQAALEPGSYRIIKEFSSDPVAAYFELTR